MSTPSSRRLGGPSRPNRWRVGVPLATAAAGVLFVASGLSADGTDLRSVTTDTRTLVVDRGADVDAAHEQVQQARAEVDDLAAGIENAAVKAARREAAALQSAAGLREVRGRGIRITLTDASDKEIEDSGRDPNDLVVHQQDIQAFVNGVWAAGAEAVSLMGQRLISTTAIKCVGNTVLLHGVPYSPPYVIEAVGDPTAMYASLNDAEKVNVYKQYVDVYGLGLHIETDDELVIPAYDGAPELDHAQAVAN